MYMIDIQVKYYTCSIMSKLTAPIPLIVTWYHPINNRDTQKLLNPLLCWY
jgi:hypothetical protein